MRITTPAGGWIRIDRDDSNVFVESPSAIVLSLGSSRKVDASAEAVNLGPTFARVFGRVYAETELAFPLAAARRLHDELGRLLEEAPR
jgi:hypothetical protein